MKERIKVLISSIIGIINIMLHSKKGILQYYPKASKGVTLRILGNGKSINDVNLGETSGDNEYMVVNRHVLADNYQIIKPQYYLLADPHFFSHPEGLSVLRKINDLTKWKMILYLPYSGCDLELIKSIITNKKIDVIPYNMCSYSEQFYLSSFFYEHQLAMPQVQNVIVAAIMIGIVRRFDIIELYGVEHNWLANLYVGDDNLVYLRNTHFFDKQIVKPKPQRDIQHLKEYPLHQNIQDYARMFKSYWEIKKYLEHSNSQTKIINKTKGSFIDAFERK